MHLWGGTTNKGREINASYLIQWESIKWAITCGCKYCDLWGIPDEIGDMLKQGKEIPKDQQGDLWGVYNFKRGFGGEIEVYLGAYDYPYQPLLYWLAQKAVKRQKTLERISGWLEMRSIKRSQ